MFGGVFAACFTLSVSLAVGCILLWVLLGFGFAVCCPTRGSSSKEVVVGGLWFSVLIDIC